MFQRKTFVSVLLASAVALPVFAQDAAQPAAAPAAAPEPDSRSSIEEIQITARKTTENLQDSPLAVSAFGADAIENLGISDTQDVSSLAPNLYLTQTPGSSANLALSIRGVAGAEPLLTREQGVALYMDDVYIARVTGAIMDLVDVERVEVLRGPQGTLYGRNSTGGAVRFISRKPSEDFGFSQRIGTGSWSRLMSRTVVNTGELLPGLAATLAYFHEQKDGYRNNKLKDQNSDYGSKNTDAFRIALGWDATEDLRFDYSFDYSNLIGHGPGFQLVAIDPTLAGALTNAGVNINNLKISRGVESTKPYAQSGHGFGSLSGNSDGASEHTIRGHNLSMNWDLGFTNWTTIASYRTWDNTEKGTELDGNSIGPAIVFSPTVFAPAFCPGGPFGAPGTAAGCLFQANNPDLFFAQNKRHQHQWSLETRFDGDLFTERLKYVAGFYYFTEGFSENNPQNFLFPFSPFAPPVQLTNNFVYNGDSRSWALFGNLAYTLPFLDDKLSVSGGVRYSKDDKDFHRLSPINSAGKSSWNSVDWETTINFQPTDDITLYFRGASAYKAGGFNLRSSLPVVNPFGPEKVKSVELGLKTNWLDRRAMVNLTGFWSITRDRQTDVFAAGPGGATSITINAGETEIPGLELETKLIPLDGLSIDANVGWIKPKYNSYPVIDSVTLLTVDVKDQAGFGYQPAVTTSIGAQYDTEPLGSMGLVLSARIDGTYTASRIWSPLDDETSSNQPVLSAFRDVLKDPAYWLMDVRFTVSEIPINDKTKARLSVYGKNVLDANYMLSGIDFGALGFAGAAYGEGATWGIDFQFDL
jgi:iron complex outermembrane receptor protein